MLRIPPGLDAKPGKTAKAKLASKTTDAMADDAEIDFEIRNWATKHSLTLFTEFDGRESRFAYVSSSGFECFQIAIENPIDGLVAVHAECIEGRRGLEPRYGCLVATAELGAALEKIFRIVLEWMAPWERYVPKTLP